MATPSSLISRSAILTGGAPNAGIQAILAPNQHQTNKIIGHLADGRKVMVAQRPGRGGMDFNKLLSGKVFAVAADALSPVFTKDENNKPTKVIKQEDGLPVYSSSGFYSLSSKEYPAKDVFGAYVSLRLKGEQLLLVRPEAVKAPTRVTLNDEADLLDLLAKAHELLADEHNLVSRHDALVNRARERAIQRAKQDTEDAQLEAGGNPDGAYTGVAFKPLAVSKKDGNPFLLVHWKAGSRSGTFEVLREKDSLNDADAAITEWLSAEAAVDAMTAIPDVRVWKKAFVSQVPVEVTIAQGHVMRTSVSFRRKAQNAFAIPAGAPVYGDAAYILGAQDKWVRGLVTVLHSMHPQFPAADYDSHYYVASVRQAEMQMVKLPGAEKWNPPVPLAYEVAALLAPSAAKPA